MLIKSMLLLTLFINTTKAHFVCYKEDMQNNDFSCMAFVTGNPDKAIEVQELLPGIRIIDVDMPEIQEVDSKAIITAKVKTAFEYYSDGPIIVDDTGFYMDCLGGKLPGPLVKWFLKSITNVGLVTMAQKMGNMRAKAMTVIGYATSPTNIVFFEGKMLGTITMPDDGPKGPGWSSILIPDGYNQIYFTMDVSAKNAMSMRSQAIKKLKAFLTK